MITNQYPRKFLKVMPYTYYDNNEYYWIEQIEFAYSQYCRFSKENLQSWLDGNKRTSRSIMKYVKQHRTERRDAIDESIIKSINESIEKMNESIGRMNESIERRIKGLERLSENLKRFNINLNNIK